MILTLFFVLIIGVLSSALDEVCTQRSVVTTTSRERYFYTYKERYQTRCWYGGTCTKTRIRTNIGFRDVPKREVQTVQVCCDGFINISSDENNLLCQPICMPSCNNGYCKSPGECICNDGYLPNPLTPHSCDPVCRNGCEHGVCVAPETCECNFGYSLNITCQPICTEPCVNGKCIAPDTCECFEGYRKSENNKCEPYCSNGCDYGICIHPELCTCNEGYTKDNDKCIPVCTDCGNGTCIHPELCECDPGYTFGNNTCNPVCVEPCLNGYCAAPFTCECDPGYVSKFENCVPDCRHDCGNGRCVAPDTCECEPGYILTNSCDPTCCQVHCSTPCTNGFCIEPDVCDCDIGYKKDFELNSCIPDCPFDCGNGSCVAPNYCECYPGFEKKEYEDTTFDMSVCQPICKNCEGKCIKPYTCECDFMFETVHQTMDGKKCDCFENCSDSSIQCDQTVCMFKTTIETTSVTEDITFQNGQESYAEDGLINYEFKTFKTETPDMLFTDIEFPEDYTGFTTETKNDIHGANVAKQQKGKDERSPSFTIYVVTGIVLLIIAIATLVAIVKRKTISDYFRGGNYSVEGKSEGTSAHSLDMTFSTIESNTRDSYG